MFTPTIGDQLQVKAILAFGGKFPALTFTNCKFKKIKMHFQQLPYRISQHALEQGCTTRGPLHRFISKFDYFKKRLCYKISMLIKSCAAAHSKTFKIINLKKTFAGFQQNQQNCCNVLHRKSRQ